MTVSPADASEVALAVRECMVLVRWSQAATHLPVVNRLGVQCRPWSELMASPYLSKAVSDEPRYDFGAICCESRGPR